MTNLFYLISHIWIAFGLISFKILCYKTFFMCWEWYTCQLFLCHRCKILIQECPGVWKRTWLWTYLNPSYTNNFLRFLKIWKCFEHFLVSFTCIMFCQTYYGVTNTFPTVLHVGSVTSVIWNFRFFSHTSSTLDKIFRSASVKAELMLKIFS